MYAQKSELLTHFINLITIKLIRHYCNYQLILSHSQNYNSKRELVADFKRCFLSLQNQ